jgi:hypothetical protein
MSALTKRTVRELVAKEEKFEAKGSEWKAREPQPDDVLIHVRFHPNSDMAAVIGERPEHVSPAEWYKLLRLQVPDCYQVFAGGRGFFRIPRKTYDAIVSKL